jgi:hypothetical protein
MEADIQQRKYFDLHAPEITPFVSHERKVQDIMFQKHPYNESRERAKNYFLFQVK